jgi:hypothetical protein
MAPILSVVAATLAVLETNAEVNRIQQQQMPRV